ncbi:unnamed protein product [Menidia menidia]|uniref:(Atlantic silverside) hypothetical protein n=1 Tax=Menidia menidia TaxID=238744 RepID=A0A8S4AKH4_9TELE|nr:unnamed protein product [Menidia menidia]
MLPLALRQICLCVVFFGCSSLGTSLPFYSSQEGSTDEEETSFVNSSVSTRILSTEHQTTPEDPAQAETDFLKQLVNFLEENMLLILVATTLLILVFLIICGAIFMSHRRKVNAYYPSSFPSNMYVDHRDKTGGAKLFNDVQEKAAPERQKEPVDSHKQLQADIMRAAKSLRTPNKSTDAAERSEPCKKAADYSPEDSSMPDGSILNQQLPSVPEEKEQCELSDGEAAEAVAGGSEKDLEQLAQEGDDSQEPSPGRSLRPPSLHIHNDSATLQLLAGEKTAF